MLNKLWRENCLRCSLDSLTAHLQIEISSLQNIAGLFLAPNPVLRSAHEKTIPI